MSLKVSSLDLLTFKNFYTKKSGGVHHVAMDDAMFYELKMFRMIVDRASNCIFAIYHYYYYYHHYFQSPDREKLIIIVHKYILHFCHCKRSVLQVKIFFIGNQFEQILSNNCYFLQIWPFSSESAADTALILCKALYAVSQTRSQQEPNRIYNTHFNHRAPHLFQEAQHSTSENMA